MKASRFALAAGLAYLAIGVLALVPVTLVPPPPGAPPSSFVFYFYGYFLGLFPVNIVHSALHIAVGARGLAVRRDEARAAAYARALAWLFGGLALLGLVPAANTVFGLMPIYGHDVWLHGGTAVLAAYFGWRHRPTASERRRGGRSDRRQRMMPVARERRFGLSDRREGIAALYAA